VGESLDRSPDASQNDSSVCVLHVRGFVAQARRTPRSHIHQKRQATAIQDVAPLDEPIPKEI
jgi:hypothetical protein